MPRKKRYQLLPLAVLAAATPLARADIYRWDNNQVIPGTTGIWSGFKSNLSSMSLTYARLDNWNFFSANLNASDLSVAHLRTANLQAAFLFSTNLTSADLSSADIRGANLFSANFTSANLFSANFSLSNLNAVNFTGASITGAGFFSASGFTNAQLFSTASYQARNLHSITLPAALQLPSQDFSSFDLSSSFLVTANLSSANFLSANLTSLNLSSSNLAAANFSSATIHGAYLAGTVFSSAQLFATASYQLHDLSAVRFPNRINLAAADLSAQNLSSATLQSAILTGANLLSANLQHADLTSANLASANLTSVDFRSATFAATVLTSAIIRYANFAGASTSTFTPNVLYSSGSYSLHDLTGINLQSLLFQNANFYNQNLTSAVLFSTYLLSADFSYANLTSANFQSAYIGGANFKGALLTGANFSNGTLSSAQLYSTASYLNHNLAAVQLASLNLTGWNLASQNLVSANLQSANMPGADLASANLTGATLLAANLASANLTSTNLISADLTLTDLRNTTGFIPAPSNSLRGAILPDATIQPFTLNPNETLRVRAGANVTVAGPITMSQSSNIHIDAGVTVATNAPLVIPTASELLVNGTFSAPGTTVTVDGYLAGFGTVNASVLPGPNRPYIFPSVDGAPSTACNLTLASLATSSNLHMKFTLYGPTNYDSLTIANADGLTLNGGQIEVWDQNLPQGYYKLIAYNGAIQGAGPSSLSITTPPPNSKIAYLLDLTHDPGFIDLHKVLIGDTNGDNVVDGADFDMWFSHLGSNAGYASGDLNSDGRVDGGDFDLWFTHLQNTFGNASLANFQSQISNPAPVPEPATLLLLTPIALCFRRRIRPSSLR